MPFNPHTSQDKYPAWEMTIEFHVHGKGTKLFGDGFAVWFTEAFGAEGPVFGSADKVCVCWLFCGKS